MTSLQSAIEKSLELESRATKGPWHLDLDKVIMANDSTVGIIGQYDLFDTDFTSEQDKINAGLAVHARNTHKKYVESVKVLMNCVNQVKQATASELAALDHLDIIDTALETVERIWEDE